MLFPRIVSSTLAAHNCLNYVTISVYNVHTFKRIALVTWNLYIAFLSCFCSNLQQKNPWLTPSSLTEENKRLMMRGSHRRAIFRYWAAEQLWSIRLSLGILVWKASSQIKLPQTVMTSSRVWKGSISSVFKRWRKSWSDKTNQEAIQVCNYGTQGWNDQWGKRDISRNKGYWPM